MKIHFVRTGVSLLGTRYARLAILSYANERVRSLLTNQKAWIQKDLTRVVFAEPDVIMEKKGVGMFLA